MTDQSQNLQNLPIKVHAQYVKDISFENPGAPATLALSGAAPQMDVGVHLDVRELAENPLGIKDFFEVVIELRVRATKDGHPLFLADIDYAMAVSLADVPEKYRHPLLLIEVPRLGFPFVRQTLSDLVTAGGFPPLLLTPIDFTTLYRDRFGAGKEAA